MFSRVLVCFLLLLLSCYVFLDDFWVKLIKKNTDWLTWLPLRGFLVIFELIQLIKLAMVSIRRFMFSHTPRDIREMTKPPYFEYAIGE